MFDGVINCESHVSVVYISTANADLQRMAPNRKTCGLSCMCCEPLVCEVIGSVRCYCACGVRG